MRIRPAVFDIIGTTVQAGDDVPSSFRKAFSSVGIALSDEVIATIRGRSKHEAISDLLLANDVAAAALPETSRIVYRRFQNELRRALESTAQPIPGSQDVFGFLGGVEIKVVLTTGLDCKTAQAIVRGLKWDGLGLTGFVSGDEVPKGRPAPDLIHAAMQLAEVEDPAAVLVVGDTTADLEAAAAAQVGWSVGVLTGAHSRARLEAHPHSVILETVADLPRWLATTGAIRGGPA
jgi:phosphonatase-like hydrolase